MAKTTTLTEQRSLIRRELIYYLKITNRKTGEELGRLGDLHAEGLLVLSERPLNVGSLYDAVLELPKALAETEGFGEMPFKGEAVWARPAPKPRGYYESGLRFIKPMPKFRQAIGVLIEMFAMPEAS